MIKIQFTVPHRKMHGTVTVETLPAPVKEALVEALESIMGNMPSHWDATIHIIASFEAIADDDA